MARIDTSAYTDFEQISARLDQIVGQVKDKNVSLERSLDLFDEAIALGSKAVDMVDTAEVTPSEESAAEADSSGAEAVAAGKTDADGQAK